MAHAEPVMGKAPARIEFEGLPERCFCVLEQARVQASLAEKALRRHTQRIERDGASNQCDCFVVAAQTRSQDCRMA